MLLQNRGHRIWALLCAVLYVVLLPFAHAVLKIENIWGIYHKYGPNIGCPTTVVVRPLLTSSSRAMLATSLACAGGTAFLTERKGQIGSRTAAIVLGKVTKGIVCVCPGVEEIKLGVDMNFIRPHTLIDVTLDNQTTRFLAGQKYLILREACIYAHAGLPPSPFPSIADEVKRRTDCRSRAASSPIACPPPASPVTPSVPPLPVIPPSPVASATSTPAAKRSANIVPGPQIAVASLMPSQSVNAVPSKSVNMWIWAGPVIGISFVALVVIVAFVAVRRARAQWYPFAFQGDSETSLRRYFASVSSTPLPRPEVDETVPRMRYPTDEDFYGGSSVTTSPVSTQSPPRDESGNTVMAS